MFILFHLFTGVLVGYLLADRLNTRAVVLPCMLGALLPDLVDKPLGILVLGGALGGGRIFLHTLLFLLLILLAGAVAYRRYDRPALLAVGVGVASHQALDVMWSQPRAWLYPFLGRAPRVNTEGWFLHELLLEIRNPLEWASAAALLVLLAPVLWPDRTDAFVARHARGIRALALGAAAPIALLGLYLLASGAYRQAVALVGWDDAGTNLIGGAVLLLTAYAAYRLAARLSGGAASIGLK
jgi:membrane-bound metal-dependent hydrolase YbcI (DUF457 family)